MQHHVYHLRGDEFFIKWSGQGDVCDRELYGRDLVDDFATCTTPAESRTRAARTARTTPKLVDFVWPRAKCACTVCCLCVCSW